MTVTLEEFITTDFEAPIRNTRILNCAKLGGYYKEAALKAGKKGCSSEERVFNLLYTVLERIWLYVRQPDNPFASSRHSDDLKGILDGLKGKQASVLSTILPSIENPSLRARLAEIVLLSEKDNEEVINRAISAYCESIGFILDKKSWFSFGDKWDDDWFVYETLRRACQLSDRIGWNGDEALHVRAIALDLYEDAYDGQSPHRFNEAGRVALDFSLVEADKIARDSGFLLGSVKEDLEDLSYLAENAKRKADWKTT